MFLVSLKKAVITLVFLVTVLATMTVSVFGQDNSETKLTLTIEKALCLLEIKVYPEKRIPRTNNWRIDVKGMDVIIKNTSNNITFNVATNNFGIGTYNLCESNQTLVLGDNFTVCILGEAQLLKRFENIVIENVFSQSVDLTTGGIELLNGETGVIRDEKINSLDISTQVRNLYSREEIIEDLNKDTKVNTLDLSNTIFNFYKLGDTCS